MNRGGFSWRRLTGISAAKGRLSRRIGVPLTKSGRQRKLGRMVSGGGCLLPVGIAVLILVLSLIACASSPTATPTPRPLSAPATRAAATSTTSTASTRPASTPTGPRANTAANLRAGPGTNYDKIGSAASGQALDIVARNSTGDWYQLRGGGWIFGELVTGAPVVPVAAIIPTAPPATNASIVTSAPATTSAPTAPAAPPARACCKHCGSNSQPCGDSCIALNKTCYVGQGCACP